MARMGQSAAACADPSLTSSQFVSTDFAVPTTADLDAMYEALKNWGRWGADDERGALNHLTDERRAAAATLAHDGRAVSLANDLGMEGAQHHMLASGDARDSNNIPGYEAAR